MAADPEPRQRALTGAPVRSTKAAALRGPTSRHIACVTCSVAHSHSTWTDATPTGLPTRSRDAAGSISGLSSVGQPTTHVLSAATLSSAIRSIGRRRILPPRPEPRQLRRAPTRDPAGQARRALFCRGQCAKGRPCPYPMSSCSAAASIREVSCGARLRSCRFAEAASLGSCHAVLLTRVHLPRRGFRLELQSREDFRRRGGQLRPMVQ